MKHDAVAAQNWAGSRVLVLSPTPTHPQDNGNRKRIFEICRRLSSEGARLTFVHYATEHDWRGRIPINAERAMAAAWQQYYTVGPTRPLHAASAGRDHLIDEWWDPAIGSFLRWLFSVQSFDILVVSRPWLSKAFEFAPASVFKILDAQDKLSGRREILASLGLGPEYFHTTEAEEKTALDRADLVWALKDEERAAFERLTATRVLTLSHLDPHDSVSRPEPDPDGYLRVGILGASNSIHRANLTRFLEGAEPAFRKTFAPVKLIVAGSICGGLGDVSYPFVDLQGTMETVREFYRSVDCVAVPAEISTGVNIAAAEAVSLDVPVVSTAHGFEGLAAGGNLHNLAGFTGLAHALADLAFAPRTELDVSVAASRSAYARTAAHIDKALRQTATLMRERRRLIVLTVDSRAFVPDSVFNLALATAHDQLRRLATLVVLVVSGSAEDLARNTAVVNRFGRVVVCTEVAHTRRLRDTLGQLAVDICATGSFLRLNSPKMVIADALNAAMFLERCPNSVMVARTELIAFSEGSADFRLPAAAYRRVFAAAPAHSRESASQLGSADVDLLLEACFPRAASDLFPARGPREEKTIALLGSPWAPAMPVALRMAKSWDLKPLVVFGMGERAPPKWESVACVRADAYVQRILKGTEAPPRFAADLSGGASGLPLCRELLERLHVPTLSASQAGACSGIGTSPLAAHTEGDLWRAFRSFAMDPYETQERNFAGVWRELDDDPGWTWLWRYCRRLLEVDDAEFAC